MENQKHRYTALYERTNHKMDDSLYLNGILAQKELLMEYAKSHNFPEIKHYSDEGISGTKFDRPALNELLREAEAGNISTVIVKDVSRIGRGMVAVLNVVAELKKNNVRVITVAEGLDTCSEAWKGVL